MVRVIHCDRCGISSYKKNEPLIRVVACQTTTMAEIESIPDMKFEDNLIRHLCVPCAKELAEWFHLDFWDLVMKDISDKETNVWDGFEVDV